MHNYRITLTDDNGDPLSAARGIMVGLIMGMFCLAVISAVAYVLVH
jgi:hypothetical protein